MLSQFYQSSGTQHHKYNNADDLPYPFTYMDINNG